jgi:hypothetical protein
MEVHHEKMKEIKQNHKLTWWLRKKYWGHESAYHKSFTALIRRRVQLQTAIKEKESSR